MVSETMIETILRLYLQGGASDPDQDAAIEKIRDVQAYEDAGVLTRDRGLVIRTTDGDEFQVSIVRSRWGTHNPEDGDEEGYCDDCGKAVEEAGNTLCDACNADYERMHAEDPDLTKPFAAQAADPGAGLYCPHCEEPIHSHAHQEHCPAA